MQGSLSRQGWQRGTHRQAQAVHHLQARSSLSQRPGLHTVRNPCGCYPCCLGNSLCYLSPSPEHFKSNWDSAMRNASLVILSAVSPLLSCLCTCQWPADVITSCSYSNVQKGTVNKRVRHTFTIIWEKRRKMSRHLCKFTLLWPCVNGDIHVAIGSQPASA